MLHDRWMFSSLVFGVGLALAGCNQEQTPPAESPAAATEAEQPQPQSSTSKKPGDDPSQSDVNISDAIKKACGLSDTEAHFAYNSANVRASDKQVLKKLADCFATGPLKGRQMNLIGHADPRGEPEYNMVLGDKRAGNVAEALIMAGLPEDQVTTTSRGELDATGTDVASWARDRRVDVVLAD